MMAGAADAVCKGPVKNEPEGRDIDTVEELATSATSSGGSRDISDAEQIEVLRRCGVLGLVRRSLRLMVDRRGRVLISSGMGAPERDKMNEGVSGSASFNVCIAFEASMTRWRKAIMSDLLGEYLLPFRNAKLTSALPPLQKIYLYKCISSLVFDRNSASVRCLCPGTQIKGGRQDKQASKARHRRTRSC